jgi:hypothetical protein
MNDSDSLLSLQASIICLLLFILGVTALIKYPGLWH